MTKLHRSLATISCLVLLVVSFGPMGCGKDSSTNPSNGGGSVTTPAAWAGQWRIMFTLRDCDSGMVLSSETTDEPICPDETFDFGIDDSDLPCTGTFTDTAFNLTCSGVETDSDGCQTTTEITLNGTRNGDAFTITGTGTTTFGTGCEFQGTFCFDVDISATRLSETPVDCTGSSLAFPAFRDLF